MARIAKNKAALSREKASLATYRRYLPALDLKRKQLIAERNRERQRLAALTQERQHQLAQVGEQLPMLADESIDLTDLVQVTAIQIESENAMGVTLPRLLGVETQVRPLGLLYQPHWLEPAAKQLIEALRLALALRVAEARLARLEVALRTVTQRYNLFDKVLIPRARANIRQIEIALDDAARASIITAKIAKGKRLEATHP